MQVDVKEAKERLEELLDRASAGEPVFVSAGPNGPSVLLVRAAAPEERARREAAIEAIQGTVRRKREAGLVSDGPDAAHCADFLYDEETGLPV
jgi:antitoxin (DNA-binding transcriptional repressor) of toxin-antitoxin stability system